MSFNRGYHTRGGALSRACRQGVTSTGAASSPSVFIKQTCDASLPCAPHREAVEKSVGAARPVQKRSAAAEATVYVCVAKLTLLVPSPWSQRFLRSNRPVLANPWERREKAGRV